MDGLPTLLGARRCKLCESNQNVEIHARQEIDLPNREVHLRAGLYEPASGNVCTISIVLSPPPPPPARANSQ